MHKALSLFDSTIGKKALMAVTGIALFGFVIAHMVGHLQMFLGPERYNAYARGLQGLGPILWVARLGLLAMVGAHLWAALSLLAVSAAARPQGYRVKRDVATSYAAKTMKISGPLLLAFIVYHVAHFTAPGVPMGDYRHQPHDAYANFVNAFHIPWVTGLYCVAMLLLGLHLYQVGPSVWNSSIKACARERHVEFDGCPMEEAQAMHWCVTLTASGHAFRPNNRSSAWPERPSSPPASVS